VIAFVARKAIMLPESIYEGAALGDP